MTKEELAFLKSQVDQVVLLEVKEERPHLGQILFVFDQGATPDVFYLRVEPVAEGGYAPVTGEERSVLLADILSVRPPAS